MADGAFSRTTLDVPSERFSRAMRRHAAGVWVISVAPRLGMTCTAVMPVSLSPPVLLVSLNQASNTLAGLVETHHFCMNLLERRQMDIAVACASLPHEERLGDDRWKDGPFDIPYLGPALANIWCAANGRITVSDHVLVVGRALHVRVGDASSPLLRFDRRYSTVAEQEDERDR